MRNLCHITFHVLRQEKRADQFLADLEEGLRLRLEPVEWPKVFQQAESLARRLSPTIRLRKPAWPVGLIIEPAC